MGMPHTKDSGWKRPARTRQDYRRGRFKPIDLSITKNIAAMFFGIVLIIPDISFHGQGIPQKSGQCTQWICSPGLNLLSSFCVTTYQDPPLVQNMSVIRPILLTLFFFIWINNMLGLIPIPPAGANLTGNIAVTMVLAFLLLL